MSSTKPTTPKRAAPKKKVTTKPPAKRVALNRDRVVLAAVALADKNGIDSLNMRNVAKELDVVPMALYKHVANKEELLTHMIDVVVSEIDPPLENVEWKLAVRARILSARQALLRHRWASKAIEAQNGVTPIVLSYMNSLIGIFLKGGFSPDLTHHVMHAIGSRMWGFTQEVFPTPPPPDDPAVMEAIYKQLSEQYPYIITIATAKGHDEDTSVGQGCDDQFEFEFALDILLDRFEQLHQQNWRSGTAYVKQPALETLARNRRINKDPKAKSLNDLL